MKEDFLLLGVSKVEITPAQELEMQGYALNNRGPFGVEAPIFVRCFLFQAGQERALIISGDLIGWDPGFVDSLLPEFQREYQLSPDAVIFNASHSHSGPAMLHAHRMIGRPSADYVKTLKESIRTAVNRASVNMHRVVASRHRGQCDVGIHRRLRVGESIEMRPNLDGPVDPQVDVIRFSREDGCVHALLTQYTCHPTIKGDGNISGDFPGYAMVEIEQSCEGAVCAFMQGCCGDVRPNITNEEGRFRPGTRQDSVEFGMRFAASIRSALVEGSMPLGSPCIRYGRVDLDLTLKSLPSTAELQRIRDDSPVFDAEWARDMLEAEACVTRPITLRMHSIRLLSKLKFLTYSAEMSVEYGLFVRDLDDDTIPLAYTNGCLGYVATGQQIKDGGYEGDRSHRVFLLSAPFDPQIEIEIRSAVTHLMQL